MNIQLPHDIAGPLLPADVPLWWVIAAALIVLVLALLLALWGWSWRVRQFKKKWQPKVEPSFNEKWDQALQKLQLATGSEQWQAAVYLLKLSLEKRWSIPVLSLTTNEVIEQMKQRETAEEMAEIVRLFRVAEAAVYQETASEAVPVERVSHWARQWTGVLS